MLVFILTTCSGKQRKPNTEMIGGGIEPTRPGGAMRLTSGCCIFFLRYHYFLQINIQLNVLLHLLSTYTFYLIQFNFHCHVYLKCSSSLVASQSHMLTDSTYYMHISGSTDCSILDNRFYLVACYVAGRLTDASFLNCFMSLGVVYSLGFKI